MSNQGIYTSRYEANKKILKEFDNALTKIREEEPGEIQEARIIILKILNPIIQTFQGELSSNIAYSEADVTSILKQTHHGNWPLYKNKIIKINNKLQIRMSIISDDDIQILEDIADAIDAECELLYRRISEGR